MKKSRSNARFLKTSWPKGRTLVEFGELSPAETLVLKKCAQGESAFVAAEHPYERPESPTEHNVVRPEFLRFLALGGDGTAPVHEMGVRIYGAWIAGDLDLQFCDLPVPLGIDWCMIEGALNVSRTHARSLRLNGTMVREIIGDGFRCNEGMFLKRGFYAHKGVRLLCAHIGGELNCDGGHFEGGGGVALNCDGARIDGSATLSWERWNGRLFRFHAGGPVHLSGAKITGDLNCDGGRFDGKSGFALVCDTAEVEKSVFLRCANNEDGPVLLAPDKRLNFEATGTVRFVHARIGADLDCLGAQIESANGHALICDEAFVGGRLLFRESPQKGFVVPLSIAGQVSVNGARVGTLVDDLECWKKASGLDLDNFHYGKIAASSPSDVWSRLKWLEMQRADYLGPKFAHQPWERLAEVFEDAKREDEAKIVRIEMRNRQRAGRWRYQSTFGRTLWFFALTRFDWLMGLLVGYGYRPWRAVWAFVCVWILGGLIYSFAAPLGVMVPNDSKLNLDNSLPAECRADWCILGGPHMPSTPGLAVVNRSERAELQARIDVDIARRKEAAKRLNLSDDGVLSWATICRRLVPAEYATFSPFLYSLDLVVPLLDLNMKKRWTQRTVTQDGNVFRPLIFGKFGLGDLVRLWTWFEVLAGLFLSLLLAATVSGIVKKN